MSQETKIPSQTAKIFKQIPKIAAEIGAVAKDEKMAGFKGRSINSVLNAASPLMAKHGIFATSQIVTEDKTEVKSSKGNRGVHLVQKFKWRFHADDGSYVETETMGEGVDYGDKSAAKCNSIAFKYALCTIFSIPTEDMVDPDRETHDLKPTDQSKGSSPQGAPPQQESQGPTCEACGEALAHNPDKGTFYCPKKKTAKDKHTNIRESQLDKFIDYQASKNRRAS